MRLKSLLYIGVLLPLFWSCNTEDDLDTVFCSGPWNVTNFFVSVKHWGKVNDGAKPAYLKPEEVKAINRLSVTFNQDGSLQGQIANGTFSGEWRANGKDRSILITNIKTTTNPAGYSRELIEALRNARFYNGDSQYLRLAPDEKDSYVQFGHLPGN